MSRKSWVLAVAVALASVMGACADEQNFIDGRRGDAAGGEGGGDDSGGPCLRGQFTCAGPTALECDGNGGTTQRIDCNAMGLQCVNRLGCRVCTPNANRCDPMNASQTQSCAADGSAWTNGALCDGASGRTCVAGTCEDRCQSSDATYLGCEYWPTITANSQLDRAFQFAVVVANPQTYPVSMNITGGILRNPMTATLMPGEVRTFNSLPPVDALLQNNHPATGCGTPLMPVPCVATSALVTSGAYHIQANGPIAAYQFNPLTYRAGTQYSFTNDASLLLPTRVLTNHYIVAARNNWVARDTAGTPRATLGGFVTIVGVNPSETGTVVTVRRTAGVSAGMGVAASTGPGTDTYTLRQGDVVQLVGSQMGQDLTGTVIEAIHPVAVFVGHDCTNVPDTQVACDHLEEQLFPSATWGRRYAVTQPRVRSTTEPYRVRIVSQRAGAMLTFEGIPTPTECRNPLGVGQFCEFQATSSFFVNGTQPILVVQFMMGEGVSPTICYMADLRTPSDRDDPACMGDPAMALAVPVEQYRHSYDFLVPATYRRNMINVIAPTGANITLDGATVSMNGVAIGSGMSVYFVPVREGRHHIESAGGEPFGLNVYGIAAFTSYWYPGGLDLAAINPPG